MGEAGFIGVLYETNCGCRGRLYLTFPFLLSLAPFGPSLVSVKIHGKDDNNITPGLECGVAISVPSAGDIGSRGCFGETRIMQRRQ